LRHLYREILKPYYRRLDDQQCADYRDLKEELANNKVDEEKSMVVKLRNQVEQKVMAAKFHTGEVTTGGPSEKDSNLNLIKRY
jgi:hypothetical protein